MLITWFSKYQIWFCAFKLCTRLLTIFQIKYVYFVALYVEEECFTLIIHSALKLILLQLCALTQTVSCLSTVRFIFSKYILHVLLYLVRCLRSTKLQQLWLCFTKLYFISDQDFIVFCTLTFEYLLLWYQLATCICVLGMTCIFLVLGAPFHFRLLSCSYINYEAWKQLITFFRGKKERTLCFSFTCSSEQISFQGPLGQHHSCCADNAYYEEEPFKNVRDSPQPKQRFWNSDVHANPKV